MITRQKVVLAAAGVGLGVAARALLTRDAGEDLRGQVVLITGGSRGLGLALAREFARHGCLVAICARDSGELRNAVRDLEERGAEALAVECDVTNRSRVGQMLESVRRHYGRIDILVNNAGVIQVGPVENMTVQDFEEAMNVMFWGVVYPTLGVLPDMLARSAGRIVNITSVGGKVSVPHLLPYSCAKFAAVGFSEGLHAELAGKGVVVTTIAPGLMRTGSYLNALFKGDREKESAWFGLSSSLPLITIGGERAARQIVRAVRRHESERVLTTPANVLARAHGLFPGITSDLLGLIARAVLPAPAGGEKKWARGAAARFLTPGWMKPLLIFGRIAARKFLQPATQ